MIVGLVADGGSHNQARSLDLHGHLSVVADDCWLALPRQPSCIQIAEIDFDFLGVALAATFDLFVLLLPLALFDPCHGFLNFWRLVSASASSGGSWVPAPSSSTWSAASARAKSSWTKRSTACLSCSNWSRVRNF